VGDPEDRPDARRNAPPPLYPEGAVFLAPLSDYTDLPFRRACRRHGCRYAFTQLIEVGSVVYRNPRLSTLLRRGDDEPWLGAQIVGADLDRISQTVEALNDRPFDVLDLNLGCPVPKVTRRGAGAAMRKTPDLAAACIEVMVRRSRVPVTAKIRILDDADPAPTVAFARRLEDAGVRALTVHGRTWERGYAGAPAAEVIRAVAETLRVPVIANGGVVDAASAAWLRKASGCSRLMVARGAIGNPWVFEQIPGAGDGETGVPAPAAETPARDEVCDELEHHVAGMVELYGEGIGLRIARKVVAAYLRGRGFARDLRGQVNTLSTWQEFAGLLARLRG